MNYITRRVAASIIRTFIVEKKCGGFLKDCTNINSYHFRLTSFSKPGIEVLCYVEDSEDGCEVMLDYITNNRHPSTYKSIKLKEKDNITSITDVIDAEIITIANDVDELDSSDEFLHKNIIDDKIDGEGFADNTSRNSIEWLWYSVTNPGEGDTRSEHERLVGELSQFYRDDLYVPIRHRDILPMYKIYASSLSGAFNKLFKMMNLDFSVSDRAILESIDRVSIVEGTSERIWEPKITSDGVIQVPIEFCNFIHMVRGIKKVSK